MSLRDECFTHYGSYGFVSVSFDSRGHVVLSVWTVYYLKKKVKTTLCLTCVSVLVILFHMALIGLEVLWESLPIMLFFPGL